MARRFDYAQWIGLLVVGVVLLMVQLGNSHLWDQDEGYYATAAAEMYARNDWITPTFNGKLFGHKPPMMYWGMMLGYHAFGVTEFGARFCSSIFGILTIMATYAIARRLFDATTGFFAGLAIGSCFMFATVARSATADAHLAFFTVMALFVWSRSYFSVQGVARDQRLAAIPWRVWLAAYAVMGLAVLTKGPIGFLFPTAVIGLFLLTEQQVMQPPGASRLKRIAIGLLRYSPFPFFKTVWKMRPFTAILAVSVVAAPWYLLVQWKTDGAFLREFIGVHHMGRFSSAMDNHSGPAYYYLLACLIGLYPWSAFAIPTVMTWVAQSKMPSHSSATRFVSCWIAVYLLIFSLASTKLPNYVLPAYPALAIIVGRYFAIWSRDASRVNTFWLHAGWLLLIAVGVGIVCGLPALAFIEFQGQTVLGRFNMDPLIQRRLAWLGMAGLPLAVFGVLGWSFLYCKKTSWAAGAFVVAATSLIAILSQVVAPELDRLQSSQMLAENLKARFANEGTQVTILGHYRPTMVFYLGQEIDFCDSPAEAIERSNANSNSILITTEGLYSRIEPFLQEHTAVIQRVAQFPGREDLIVLGDQSLMR